MAEEVYEVQALGDHPVTSSEHTTTSTTIPTKYYYTDWGQSSSTISWSYTNTVYMYQLVCPRCFERNWGQIDQIITCKGKIGKKSCNASLKAIKEKADYEVPVGYSPSLL